MKRYRENQSPEFAFRYIFSDKKEVVRMLITMLCMTFSMSIAVFGLQYASDSLFSWAHEKGYESSFRDLLSDGFPDNLYGWSIMLFPVIFMIWSYYLTGSAFRVYGKKRKQFIKALKMTDKHDRDAIAVPAGEFLFYYFVTAFTGLFAALIIYRTAALRLYDSGMTFMPLSVNFTAAAFIMISGIICIFGNSLRSFYRQNTVTDNLSVKKRSRTVSVPVALATAVTILIIQFGIFAVGETRVGSCEYGCDFSVITYADMESVVKTQKYMMETGAFSSSCIQLDDEKLYNMIDNDTEQDSEPEQEFIEKMKEQLYSKILFEVKDYESYAEARRSFADRGIVLESGDSGMIYRTTEKAKEEGFDKVREILMKTGMPLYRAYDSFGHHTGRDKLIKTMDSLINTVVGAVLAGCILLVINKNHERAEMMIKDLSSESDEDLEHRFVNRIVRSAVVSTLVGSLIAVPFYLGDGDVMVIVHSLIIMAVNVVLSLFTIRKPAGSGIMNIDTEFCKADTGETPV